MLSACGKRRLIKVWQSNGLTLSSLPYGRITYTGSKGRATPSQPETGTPSVIVRNGTGIL